LIESGDKLIFRRHSFNSPSSASNMVLGRNSNGFTEWENAKGKHLRKFKNY
jgi:hypothetical protein